MPSTAGLDRFDRPSVLDTTWRDDEQAFLTAYLARKNLTHWVDTKGQRVFEEYVVTHPGSVAARFAREAPYVIAPPKNQLIYNRAPREVMPAAISNLLFATTTGPRCRRAILGDVGLLALVCLVLVFVPRQRTRNHALIVVAAAVFALAPGRARARLGALADRARAPRPAGDDRVAHRALDRGVRARRRGARRPTAPAVASSVDAYA